MSHELETIDGVTLFVTARENAWHRLGEVADDTMTAAQLMEKAHLAGWKVRKIPLQTQPWVEGDRLISPMNVPGEYATVRDNPVIADQIDVLGRVGEVFNPIQNEEQCELLDYVVDQSGAHYETGGSLRGGADVFVTMKLPKTMMIGGVDPIDIYLASLNSHNGRSSHRLITTPIRVVCANTETAAIKHAQSSFTIRHTTNSRYAMAEVRQALGLTFKYVDAFEEEAERMIQETLTEAAFMEIVDDIFEPRQKPTPAQARAEAERAVTLERLFLESETLQNVKGTRWAAYNAFTEYVDHFAPVRGAHGEALKDRRAIRTLTSRDAMSVKERAFDLLSV